MPPIDTDNQWVRIKAHRKHGKHRKLTSREIISVNSVSSVWDIKGHTDATDGHRFMICIIHVDL